MPHVDRAIESWDGQSELTHEAVAEMADRAVSDSAIMTMAPFGHSERSVGDVARTLVLAGLASRWGFFPFFPFYPPFFWGPFPPRHPGFRPGPGRPGHPGRPGGHPRRR